MKLSKCASRSLLRICVPTNSFGNVRTEIYGADSSLKFFTQKIRQAYMYLNDDQDVGHLNLHPRSIDLFMSQLQVSIQAYDNY